MKIDTKIIRLGLTLAGTAGVAITSWLSVKCHDKAKDISDKKKKVKAYAPAIASGVLTSACILGSHHMSSKEIAALTATATYAVANRNKLEEKLSPYISKEEAKQIKHDVASASVVSVPNGPSVEWTGNGTLRVLEGYSGRQFYSSLEAVIKAEEKLCKRFKNGEYVCMNDFYEYLGIQKTHFGDQWGWAPSDDFYPMWYEDNSLGFENNIVDGDDGEPLLVIDVYTYPMEGWKEV